ncbi:uncharacterized protein LOC108111463 [Drosophila eugracilis]|uniref:uncharacterized protein LOC108111463 n=1 Tax=Drosophila eugracilis TaxID=29029 RepID=UPI001BD99C38|nr:uncharacterized protein LOC108111463 [Drosophila eugracilis]
MFNIPKPRIRNFYVKDSVAYTEDRKVVRRLKLCSTCPFLEQTLASHLSTFGTVEECHWDPDKLEGSVLYKEATEAAKALYCNRQTVNGRYLTLQACDTWDQPDEQDNPDSKSAYDLPVVDDIWRKVLEYLPLDSRLNFASSCQRFQDIYKMESQRLSKVIKMDDVCKLTNWAIRRMMQHSGKHIKRLEGGPIHSQWKHLLTFANFLGLSAKNLTELHFDYIPLTTTHMINLFHRPSCLNNITNLSLRHCDITDQHFMCLVSLTKLKSLDIGENTGIRGDMFCLLPSALENLNVNRCENLEYSRLSFVGSYQLRELHCSEIRVLDFNRLWVDNDQLEVLAQEGHVYSNLTHWCPSLEVLEVSVCPYLDEPELGKLSHLRKLVLRSVPLEPLPYQVNNSLLMALVELDSLRHLEFQQAGPAFVDGKGLRIISLLKELRTLILRNQNFKANELMELRKLNALEYLDLSDSTNLSNEIVVELAKALRRLRRFKVKRCPLISSRLTQILKDIPLLQVDV